MLLSNLWGKIKAQNVIAEFLIVTSSVVVALAGDRYFAHQEILDQQETSLKDIYVDLQKDYKQTCSTDVAIKLENKEIILLLRHASRDSVLNDSTINASFLGILHFRYFDRSVANTINYDSKIKYAGKQIIQNDSLSHTLASYYEQTLNNLSLITESRKDYSFNLERIISEESGYLDNGVSFIHGISKKPFSVVLEEMTSNIRIMSQVSGQIGFNQFHRNVLQNTLALQKSSMADIQAFFDDKGIEFEKFNPSYEFDF